MYMLLLTNSHIQLFFPTTIPIKLPPTTKPLQNTKRISTNSNQTFPTPISPQWWYRKGVENSTKSIKKAHQRKRKKNSKILGQRWGSGAIISLYFNICRWDDWQHPNQDDNLESCSSTLPLTNGKFWIPNLWCYQRRKWHELRVTCTNFNWIYINITNMRRSRCNDFNILSTILQEYKTTHC